MRTPMVPPAKGEVEAKPKTSPDPKPAESRDESELFPGPP